MENRVYIEKSLDNNMPFKEIAKYLCKDPSTISKEIRKHRSLTERNNFVSPNRCIHRGKCGRINVCNRAVSCGKKCHTCAACNSHCDQFVPETCITTKRAPYVCNGCSKRAH